MVWFKGVDQLRGPASTVTNLRVLTPAKQLSDFKVELLKDRCTREGYVDIRTGEALSLPASLFWTSVSVCIIK